ncbi:MAG TPA: nucleoid-associated protein [Tenuifilaceae bacterium]|nr:nucleoid-associated protein [Tenuifilaceae bacterium]HPJ46382.1 nucleoid-associated protein [Tenuifilaceae bacterium]HPQ34889.1 nucleoid-associated protein [Tenuifilaceae bacterium]
MFDFSEAQIESIAIHRVGSRAREDEITLAQSLTQISDESVLELLKNFFLSPFKQPEFYSFSHESSLELNEIFSYSQKLFGNPETLLEQSVNMAKHLYQSSSHPNIKDGEFYVVHLTNCVVEGELVDALGLFKSENKDTFIKIYQKNDAFGVEQHQGINIKKLDKGCLIFNTEKEFGFKVVAIDNTNRNDEARFWKEIFLNIKPREDNFYQTTGYLTLCKDFVKDVLYQDTKTDRVEQVSMLNKTRDYFAKTDVFDQDDFEQKVINKPEVVEAFRDYKEAYQEEMGCNLQDSFTISVDAAKQAKKFFKSVIKLDKNFHIYIHGGKDRVEKGFDHNKGLNYYTLYFDAEG